MAASYTVHLRDSIGSIVSSSSGNKKQTKQWVSETVEDLRNNGYVCGGSFDGGLYVCDYKTNHKHNLKLVINQLG